MNPKAVSRLALCAFVAFAHTIAATAQPGPPQASPDQMAALAGAAKYACGPLLRGSANFVRSMLDPFTGLPYDQLVCGCPWSSEGGVCQSSGVLPQLAYASINTFVENPAGPDALDWGFVDDLASGADPTLLYALELRLTLAMDNRFGGLIWGAVADVSRYDRLRIRYRTATPTSRFELKLNSGLGAGTREVAVELPGSPADGSWSDRTFLIADDFPGTDAAHLNYLVVATSLDLAGEPQPVLWVDHLAFLADPAQAARCDVKECDGDAGCYPDLARYEPQTGAVNVANAVAGLTLLAEAGLMDPEEAEAAVGKIIVSLSATPRADGWMQDWHSPASLMPHPSNRIGSMTDLPQLYAALMVAEVVWPDLAPAAAALREGMVDFAEIFDAVASGECPGELHWAMDQCAGRQPGTLDYFGNDTLLGEFLAIASGAVPPAFWSQCLSRRGCELRGDDKRRWYTTGAFDCAEHEIPAAETGGPFLQLAGLLYLTSERVPVGSLSLADSAYNMLAAQGDFAWRNDLTLWGWANHSDADACGYVTCSGFIPEQATPYVCAMGLDLRPGRHRQAMRGGRSCAMNLRAFHRLGASAPLATGVLSHDFGLRDGWNQTGGGIREDNYLYLDTGWTTLGLLNACRYDLVRHRFAAHPVARTGYRELAKLRRPCP